MSNRSESTTSACMRRTIELVPSLLAYWDRDLVCRFANEAHREWFGADPDALIGTPIRDLLGPEVFAAVQAHVVAALRGEPQVFDSYLPGPGGPRLGCSRYTPDVQGAEVIGLAVQVSEVIPLEATEEGQQSLIDMLAAERARAALESSRLAAIVESSVDAIVGKTLDGRITTWNAAAQALFGYSPAEAIGQPIQILIPHGRESEEMAIIADIARGVRVPAFDTVRRTKDGTLRDVSITVSPIRDARGRIVGASKIARDVTVQRRAEAALRQSEERLRFTVESAQIGQWELDLGSGVMQRTLQFDRCCGYDEAQGDWRLENFFDCVHAQDRERIERAWRGAIAVASNLHAECRVIWADASVHWVRLHGSVSTEPRGRMRGIISDITLQKLAEESRLLAARLEGENRQIQEASRLKNQFLANMSHELRTPLNAVIGFADLLHSGAVPPDAPEFSRFLGHIASSGRHLLRLINDVLDLSKVEAGKFEFRPEPLTLLPVIESVRDSLAPQLAEKQIAFGIDLDPGLGPLELDPGRLRQVLYNYLSNAIKFTAPGGRVTVRAERFGPAHFLVEVEDDGIGIDATDQHRLFKDFEQIDASSDRKHQGTGLGLALTRRMVQAQGGSVGVRSERGKGSVFHFVLPRAHGGAPGQCEFAPGEDRHRVLVIEDDQSIQARVADALTAVGFRVDTASTAEQAKWHSGRHDYDAITLDLLLPDDTGLGLLTTIRTAGTRREAPVVGVSLSPDPGRVAAFAVANLIHKPLRANEVALALSCLRERADRPGRVLVIDDDPLALELMSTTLADMGIEAACRLDARQALNEIQALRPDAMILDLMMPGFNGFEVLDALRRMPVWFDLPVYIWTCMNLTEVEYATLHESAVAILNKGGAGVDEMLEALRNWRPAMVAPAG